MSGYLRIFVLICGFGFTISIIYFLVKRKISERNSLLWLMGSFVILILSIIPKSLDIMAVVMGVRYPPALLFLFSTLFLLLVSLIQSIQISILNEHMKELAQQVAINKFLNSSVLKDEKYKAYVDDYFNPKSSEVKEHAEH